MVHGYNSSFEDEPNDDVPNQVFEKTVVSSLKLQQQEYEKAQSLTKTIEAIRTDYLKELRAVVTPSKWSRWTETRFKHRTELRDAIAKAEPTYEGEKQIKKKKKDIIANGEKLRRDTALNVTRATKLRDQHSNRLDKEIIKAWEIPAKPTFLTSEEPSDNPHAWNVFNPPYSGQSFARAWYKSDEPSYPIYTSYLNRIAGQLGSYTYTRVYGADDSDTSWIWVRTGLRFWYKMPATGIFELYLKLQAIYDTYWGDLDDEWGWSDAKSRQYSRPYVRVIYPTLGNIRYGNHIFYYYRHDNDAYWNRHVVGPGNYRWAHVLSDASYPANQWLYVEAGIYDRNYFWCNDVTVRSKMNMKWFVPSIYIRPKT